MLKYIKQNKAKIAVTVAKVVTALIVPGGLIVLGAYELGKLKQRKKDDNIDIQDNTQNVTKSE